MRSSLSPLFKYAEFAVAGLLSVIAIGLHAILYFNVGDPWRDEVSAIAVASMPNLGAIWETSRHDSFPILYYALLHAWIAIFGETTTSIRALGLGLGLGGLGSIWWLARRLGIGTPLLLLAMVAMSASVIRYGDAARAYGLALIAAAFMLGTIWTLLSDYSKKNAALAAVACIAAAHSTYQNSLLLLAIGIAAILALTITRRWRNAVAVAVICAATAASITIYLPAINYVKSLADMIPWVISAPDVFNAFGKTVSAGYGTWQQWVWLAFVLTGLTGGFAALLIPERQTDSIQQDDAMARSLFVALVIPLLAIVFTIFMIRSNYAVRPWYLLGLMLVLAATVEAGIAALPAPPVAKQMGRLVAAIVIGVLAVINAPAELKRRATNMPDLIAAIERSGGPNDLIILTEWYTGTTFNHLYRGSKKWMTIPDLGRHSVHRWDLVKDRMQGTSGVTREIEHITNTLLAGNRVFVIGNFVRIPPHMAQVQLPPAPHPQAGWNAATYTGFWAAQAGATLSNYATQSSQLQAPASAETMMIWENFPLTVYSRTR